MSTCTKINRQIIRKKQNEHICKSLYYKVYVHNTHCNLLPLLCDPLPLMDELSCRCATFITNVLDSDNDAVSYVARHGVYFSRMLSPIGRNALFWFLRYGVQLQNIASIKKVVVRGYVRHAQSPDVILHAVYYRAAIIC